MTRFHLFFALSSLTLAACQGAEGPAGAAGAAGASGADGADGVDGADGADGVDGANGAPRTKGDLYTVQETSGITPYTQTNLTASCDDEDDVLLTGGCSHSATEGMLYGSYPVNADDEGEVAYWSCGITSYDERTTLALHAYAVCIRID